MHRRLEDVQGITNDDAETKKKHERGLRKAVRMRWVYGGEAWRPELKMVFAQTSMHSQRCRAQRPWTTPCPALLL